MNEHRKVTINTAKTKNEQTSIPSEVVISKMHLDAGLLGKLFGNRENAPTNFIGLLMIFFIFGGVVILIKSPAILINYLDKIIIPIFAAILTLICKS